MAAAQPEHRLEPPRRAGLRVLRGEPALAGGRRPVHGDVEALPRAVCAQVGDGAGQVLGRADHRLRLVDRRRDPAVPAGGPTQRGPAPAADPHRDARGLGDPVRHLRACRHVVLALVVDRLGVAPPHDELEGLVGHRGPGPVVAVVTQRGEVLRDAQPGAEREPPTAQRVERVHRPRQHVRAVPGDRRHVGDQPEAVGRAGHRRQGDPRVADAAPEVAVVPDAQPVPAGGLGGPGQLHDGSGLRVGPERDDLDAVPHGCLLVRCTAPGGVVLRTGPLRTLRPTTDTVRS